MKFKARNIIAFVLSLTMIFSTVIPSKAYGFNFDATQSSWAEAELSEAYDLGLTYENVMKNFKNNITREEFCTLVIKLYEKLTGKIAAAGTDPFKDTDNKEILKAYVLGIVKGTSADTFSPYSFITRQEICVMIYRTLSVSVANLDTSSGTDFPFKDASKIASWATDDMKFAYKNGIMKGLSPETIDPISNTTREQGIILLLRTYKKYQSSQIKEPKAVIPVEKGPSPSTNQKYKFGFYAITNNLFKPEFDQRIELFVATKEGKPAALPVFSQSYSDPVLLAAITPKVPISPITPVIPNIDLNINPNINPNIIKPNIPDINYDLLLKARPTGPVYTKNNFAAFIDKDGDKTRWFAFKLKNAQNVTKIIYQVSITPFAGYKEGWKTNPAIIYQGEILPSAKEFSIDFSKVDNPAVRLGSISLKNIPEYQKTFYVRAVPVDTLGNPIGDPGNGIAVTYGEKLPVIPKLTESSFELWTTQTDLGYTSSEFKDLPRHDPLNNGNEVSHSPKLTTPRAFHFHDIDSKTTKIIIQVSNKAFDIAGRENIIYEKEYSMPVSDAGLPDAFKSYIPSVSVPFSQFGKSASEMKENEYIFYYVRGIAVKDSFEPGKSEMLYSDVVRIKYGYIADLKLQVPTLPEFKEDKRIGTAFPTVRIKEYKEVQWPDPNYMQHYYIADTPKPMDILCSWKNVGTKEVLRPFFLNPTQDQNEYQKAINRVLPLNAKVYFPDPSEEDKPWYEELIDGVKNFFSTLAEITYKIYASVQSTYASIKSGLVSFVANLCPEGPFKGLFKTALEGLLNYGLMWCGIPPELPDFSKLAQENMDYFVDLALTEAGVPQNAVTDEIRQKMEEEMIDEFEKAGRVKDENPINAPFLKLDPDYLYRPAYIDIEVTNDDPTYATVPGVAELRVEFRFDNYDLAGDLNSTGLNLTVDTFDYGANQSTATFYSTQYNNHFTRGLNGYTVNFMQAQEAVYDVFKPMTVKIPSIRPNSSQIIRVYLEPAYAGAGNRYPNSESSDYQDFNNMYFNNGDGNFTYFKLTSYLPTAEEYLVDQAIKKNLIFSLDPNIDYVYSNAGEDSYYVDLAGYKVIEYNNELTGGVEELQRKIKYGWKNNY